MPHPIGFLHERCGLQRQRTIAQGNGCPFPFVGLHAAPFNHVLAALAQGITDRQHHSRVSAPRAHRRGSMASLHQHVLWGRSSVQAIPVLRARRRIRISGHPSRHSSRRRPWCRTTYAPGRSTPFRNREFRVWIGSDFSCHRFSPLRLAGRPDRAPIVAAWIPPSEPFLSDRRPARCRGIMRGSGWC